MLRIFYNLLIVLLYLPFIIVIFFRRFLKKEHKSKYKEKTKFPKYFLFGANLRGICVISEVLTHRKTAYSPRELMVLVVCLFSGRSAYQILQKENKLKNLKCLFCSQILTSEGRFSSCQTSNSDSKQNIIPIAGFPNLKSEIQVPKLQKKRNA